jgi:alkaline phosphatase
MINRFAAAFLAVLVSGSPILAQTVYPIDRAEILSGAQFDFKVEFPDRVDPAKLKVTINGEDYSTVFGRTATFIEREDGKEQSALLLRDVALAKPGPVTVEVSDGTRSRRVAWTVYDTGPRKAKNVILFIGDGLSPAHRTAARLSGVRSEASANGVDDMPHMALVATAGRIPSSRVPAREPCHRPQDRLGRDGRLLRPHCESVRRPKGRNHHQSREAPAQHGHRYRHQH